jgi:hypothetical protein
LQNTNGKGKLEESVFENYAIVKNEAMQVLFIISLTGH